ncbi:hypothetical protein Tco_1474619 [Tanacetum coccineum]
MPVTPSPRFVNNTSSWIWCRSAILSISSPNEPNDGGEAYVNEGEKEVIVILYPLGLVNDVYEASSSDEGKALVKA